MYYWRSHKASVASDISAKPYAIAAAKGAVAAHLQSCGFKNFEIKSTDVIVCPQVVRRKIRLKMQRNHVVDAVALEGCLIAVNVIRVLAAGNIWKRTSASYTGGLKKMKGFREIQTGVMKWRRAIISDCLTMMTCSTRPFCMSM